MPLGGAPSRGRRPRRRTRLALLVCLGALVPGIVGARPAGATPPAATVEELAGVAVTALPPPPLFLGLAHVVVPPGVGTTTAGTAGPRLIVVESGVLTVGTTDRADALVNAGNAATRWVRVTPGADVVLGPGDRLVLGDSGLREVRNGGARPTVFLDAALFPAGSRTIDAAFTTEEGISFQLLAGVIVDAVPPAPVEFALSRIHLPHGAALPTGPRDGPAVAYVEAGSLGLVPSAGAVQFSRAAAPTPFSTAGPMRVVALGTKVTLTAGASVFLPAGSAVAAENGRDVPATLLLLEARPARRDLATPTIAAAGP